LPRALLQISAANGGAPRAGINGSVIIIPTRRREGSTPPRHRAWRIRVVATHAVTFGRRLKLAQGSYASIPTEIRAPVTIRFFQAWQEILHHPQRSPAAEKKKKGTHKAKKDDRRKLPTDHRHLRGPKGDGGRNLAANCWSFVRRAKSWNGIKAGAPSSFKTRLAVESPLTHGDSPHENEGVFTFSPF